MGDGRIAVRHYNGLDLMDRTLVPAKGLYFARDVRRFLKPGTGSFEFEPGPQHFFIDGREVSEEEARAAWADAAQKADQ